MAGDVGQHCFWQEQSCMARITFVGNASQDLCSAEQSPAVGRHMPEPRLAHVGNCLKVRCHCSFDEFLEQMKRRGKPG